MQIHRHSCIITEGTYDLLYPASTHDGHYYYLIVIAHRPRVLEQMKRPTSLVLYFRREQDFSGSSLLLYAYNQHEFGKHVVDT